VKNRKPEKKFSKPETNQPKQPPRPTRKPSPEAKPPARPKAVAAAPEEGAGERIQKVLARGGVGSRREIERWIQEGRVMVNGAVAALGVRLQRGDTLQINGRYVDWQKYDRQPTRVLLYHKPTGEVVTRRDPEGRPVVFTQLPKLAAARWIAVGRLDINTSGLLLVTNNGELANLLMHPKTQIEREYAVRILGEVSEATIEKLKQGVELEDGLAKFNEVRFYAGEGANKWYYVTVSEGRNRLVRRLWESQQVVVSRLMRVRYGPVVLPERLKAHSFYELSDKELDILFEFAGLPRDNAAAQPKAEARSGRPRKK